MLPTPRTVQRESRVTVKIPRPLYRRIQQVIDGSGFSSPTDFIVFVLRDLVAGVNSEPTASPDAEKEEFSPEELREVTRKLKNLGYLD